MATETVAAGKPIEAKTTTTKTYLITGGAGFLGINLVRYLLERGHRVVSLDIADFTYPERPQITEIKGDIRDKAAVDRAMQGVDIVIHTAAALPLYTPEDIYSTDIDGLRNVLQAAYEHGARTRGPCVVDGGVRYSGPSSAGGR